MHEPTKGNLDILKWIPEVFGLALSRVTADNASFDTLRYAPSLLVAACGMAE